MFRVVICDDDAVFCELLEKAILSYLSAHNKKYSINVYQSIGELQSDLAKGCTIDILFLDIEFAHEKLNGVDLANYIRKILRDDYIEIVYISSQEKYAMQLFETRPLHFLIKPIQKREVADVLGKVARIREIRKKFFTYKYRSKRFRIELGAINYFISEGRRIRIVCTSNREFLFNGKISSVLQELDENGFFSPHKSYVVNYYAVEQWGRSEMIIRNGDYIPISRTKENEMKALQLKYERGLL